jgi:glucan biosynthesis protein C
VNSEAASPIARNYSLDAARGVLMMLGVIIHSADIYSTNGEWLFQDSQSSEVFDVIINLIHVFRMPVFFWISGYFCALTFTRNGADGLLRKRVPRLVIPLLTTWVSLNLMQALLVSSLTGQSAITTILEGIPLYHLWFLIDLIIFVFGAALVLPRLKYLEILTKRIETLPIMLMFPALALFSLVISLSGRSTGIAYESIFSLTSIFRLVTYVPYFIGGIFMFGRPELKATFLKVPAVCILVTLPLASYFDNYTHGNTFAISELALLGKVLMIWLSIAGVLRLFQDLVQRGSRITYFLSDAAYTVYLFHHILVVTVGIMLLNFEMNLWLKFLIVSSSSLFGSALIHTTLIRRYLTLRLLFNGK